MEHEQTDTNKKQNTLLIPGYKQQGRSKIVMNNERGFILLYILYS